ncbi:MAG: hypothetical protein ABFD16_06225 [Thermoguttaceae bacterium]
MHRQQQVEYQCPGEKVPISRAVHLGRLTRCFPVCRQCPHHLDTAGLSARQVKRLTETQCRGERRSLFHDEGVAGVYLNDFHPETAKDLAAAFGVYLQRAEVEAVQAPVVVIGGDGRPLTPEITAAVSEGIRWAGCHVIDIGQASAACLAFAIDQVQASGGILAGNPSHLVQTVGLKFWASGAQPLSAGPALETVRGLFEAGTDRPTRRYGSLRRFQADIPYLASLAEQYHALRPLRFILDTNCQPLLGYLEKLLRPVACELLPCRTTSEQVPAQIQADRVHFAARIDDDGQRLLLWDERGQRVDSESFLVLIARHLMADQPGGTVVVEQDTSGPGRQALARLGCQVIASDARPEEMARSMGEHRARLGGGPSGRLWYGRVADALQTLTHLLVLLSQSDRPLSQVLDATRPAG